MLLTLELADLWHKAKLLPGMLGSGRDFDAELPKVVRNASTREVLICQMS